MIVALEDFGWRNNTSFRKNISKLGRERNIDSILILTGNPEQVYKMGYHCFMEVYEPRADSISTMCGNGIRAVCQYWIDNGSLPENGRFLINTGSGIREVSVLGNSLFRANMGLLSIKISDLGKYVKISKFPLSGSNLDNIPRRFGVERVIIGMTGNRINGKLDGEPHLIFFLNRKNIFLAQLNKYATQLGKIFTQNKKIFPLEINTSVAVQNLNGSLSLCTYERGIYYVTQSCGTACAVAGGYLLNNQKLQSLSINTLGGKLLVEVDKEKNVFLTGNATPLNNFLLEKKALPA